ncbi:hypothetical protein AVEN_95642-1 [Araneus ventricosus]|uniref:Uncharacterized protein n=1 Tax=Araneus ventricosus TaxID=182803 RepID=A0A4Y2U7C1_ARAVE|nr:hypothetical protein AVEN_95642-1 [Araneus ventricosus]
MQFGFRKHLLTVQQLLPITEIVKEGMDVGWDTGAVFLDIAKAFDNVWTDGLLYKLITMWIPGGLVRLMATYLRGKRFAVRVGSDVSSERAIDAGVAQGSKIDQYCSVFTSTIFRATGTARPDYVYSLTTLPS